jgi:hypothetical protein
VARATNWITDFIRDGFALFPGLIHGDAVASVRTRIDEDLRDNYDPARKVEYDNRSFCPDLLGSPVIMGLFHHDGVRERIEALIGLDKIGFDGGQIAIRRAHNVDRPAPPEPHIDGIPSPTNGLSGAEINPFTLLVGVFLSGVQSQFAGNFTVWPGSHMLIEAYFKQRGPRAMREGMPKVSLAEPRQVLCAPGDVVFCHYQLAHGAAVNTSDFDRYAVFFRVWHHDLRTREPRWKHLTNIWTGWNVGQ